MREMTTQGHYNGIRNVVRILAYFTLIISGTFQQSNNLYSQPTQKQIRQQKKVLKKHQKEQLSFKADSIKIAAMLPVKKLP